MAKVTDVVAQLAAPVVEQAGCSLWDVEYVKEAGEWFLRVYIDKEGGISIDQLTSGSFFSEVEDPCWTRPTPSRAAIPSRCPPPGRTGC